MKKGLFTILLVSIFIFLTACGGEQNQKESTAPTVRNTTTASTMIKETTQSTVTATEKAATAPVTQNTVTEPAQTEAAHEQPQNNYEQSEYEEERPQEVLTETLQMIIGNTPVSVAWEDNEAVHSLKELCRNQPLTIQMSMYGGFEQVGNIGADLPRKDVQTTTSAGDIVLYSGNQMVVFYGSNTWAYTKLGHITDQSADDMANLLSNGDTEITISLV